MKRLLLATVTFLSFSCFAQEQPKIPTIQPPFVQTFMGYIIKVNAHVEGRYGYDILFESKMIVSQQSNPFNSSFKGLANREDALKVARWQVQQLAAGTPAAVLANQSIPSAIARQLNISVE